jgi:hypothetical protein
MALVLTTEEERINTAICEEFRVLKSRRNWDNKQVLAVFRHRGLPISHRRLSRLLLGQRRLTAAELLILESEGLSVSSVKELLQRKPR